LPFVLVSDASEAVCQMFDVIKAKKMYGREVRGIERSTFLIDAKGVLRQQWRAAKAPPENGDGTHHVHEVLAAVQAL
jgi:peroxiredoxin Q/BCP